MDPDDLESQIRRGSRDFLANGITGSQRLIVLRSNRLPELMYLLIVGQIPAMRNIFIYPASPPQLRFFFFFFFFSSS